MRQPQGLFQVIGIMACVAIYVGHLQDAPPATGAVEPLTIGSQVLPERLFGGLLSDPTVLSGPTFVSFTFACFAIALLLATSGRRRSAGRRGAAVAIQILIGLLVSNDLLLVVAAQLPIVFRPRAAVAGLAAQSLGMAVVWGYVLLTADLSRPSGLVAREAASPGSPRSELALEIATSLLLFAAWQTFAFFLGRIAMSERVHRDRLAASHAQLLATQQLLSESARSGERLRIARDLHDGLGHHLTALGLHLDLAERQSGEARRESVATARGIARELLAEVRGVVQRERQEEPIDLERSLRTLCAGIPGMTVSFDYGEDCRISDPAQAQATFRCVQEAASNALRHADASRLWIVVRCVDGGIAVDIRDDGRGAAAIRPGSGLNGMRERVEACGGRLRYGSEADAGFGVAFWLPLRRESS